MLIMVGTIRAWVTRSAAIVSMNSFGSNSGMIVLQPANSAQENVPRPSAMWNIGAACRKFAPGEKPTQDMVCRAFSSRLRWLSMTPFERPVVPPV